MRTLVIGVGNLLRTDDGVGIQVIRNLNNFVPGVDTLDAAMGGVEILEAMRGYDQVIIVDAIESGAEPGTIFRVNLAEGEEPPVISHSHGIDLITTLNLGRQLYGEEMPGKIILFAVEAEDSTTISDEPTPKVRAAIQETIKAILAITDLSQ
jgi:hydrogenase maturation protease